MPAVNGILLIDKPEGITSAGVVREVKRALAEEKVGHLGTLDPFASGLLPVCLGSGTKIAQFLMVEQKAYSGTIRLGVETDTFDSTGTVTQTSPVPDFNDDALRQLEAQFTGEQWQTPPMYSAIKRKGVPLYKLARQGIEVEREPRKVTIEQLVLARQSADTLGFSLVCSKGTYVRSLAVALGAALGGRAHLATLRRTAFGPFAIAQAVALSLVTAPQTRGPLPLLSLPDALLHYRAITIPERMTALLRQGRQETLLSLSANAINEEIIRLLSPTAGNVGIPRNLEIIARLLNFTVWRRRVKTNKRINIRRKNEHAGGRAQNPSHRSVPAPHDRYWISRSTSRNSHKAN